MRLGESSSADQLSNHTNLFYSEEMTTVLLMPRFKVLQIELYDGSRDPIDHIENFKANMIVAPLIFARNFMKIKTMKC